LAEIIANVGTLSDPPTMDFHGASGVPEEQQRRYYLKKE
jgi:hypothetical protein